MRDQLRDMELDNDDLEKSEREKDSSLQDLENRYNKSLERIALLEEELVTKAQLEEEVQRLKDELRGAFLSSGPSDGNADCRHALVDLNEELTIVRSAALPAPEAPSRPLTPPGTAMLPPAIPLDPDHTPTSHSTLNLLKARPDTRRTPSPSAVTTPPSIELVNPTPLHASTLPTSPSVRAALNRPSAPHTPGSIPRSSTLARSTRMSQLGSMLPQSPSTTAFPRSRSPVKTSQVPPRRTETMIRDMQMMTSRVKQLTQRLDSRRNLVMAGSAIPRASMSPTSSHVAPSGLARSTTRTQLARSTRPTSRLGHHSTTSSSDGSNVITSTRPPSRSTMRQSMHGPRSSIPGPIPPLPTARPHSRMSNLSASSANGSSRPVTPSNGLPSRSPTPTTGFRSSSRPPWNASLGKSVNGTAAEGERRRVVSSSNYGPRSDSLTKTIGPGTTSSGRASVELGRTVRRPPSSTDGTTTINVDKTRRVSSGIGLGSNGLARSVIGRRVSTSRPSNGI